MQLIRTRLSNRGIPEQAEQYILNSWPPSARTRYSTAPQEWERFCIKEQSNPLKSSLINLLKFDRKTKKRLLVTPEVLYRTLSDKHSG